MRDRDLFDHENDLENILTEKWEFEEHLVLEDAQRARDINKENGK